MDQTDLEGNPVPVRVTTEEKKVNIWTTANMRVKCSPEALEKFEEKVEKKQDPKDKSDLRWEWLQSRAKVTKKGRLMPGTWTKETAELFDEIFGGF